MVDNAMNDAKKSRSPMVATVITASIIGFISGGLGFAAFSFLPEVDAASSLEFQTARDALKKETAEVQRRKDELKALEKEVRAASSANIKTSADFMQSMPTPEAAQTIKDLSNEGNMDYAIQLLRNIEGRNVAKILAELEDATLIAEIAERYRDLPNVR